MAGIYLHIPFCKQACHYCDFHFSTNFRNVENLVVAMLDEIVFQKDFLGGEKVDTIYLGGGTPSAVPSMYIERLINHLFQYHEVDTYAEITLEANPDDLIEDNLQDWKRMGINRLSVGVQSFNDLHLQSMNRAHNQQQALDGLQLAKKIGFKNITMDLIYGIPDMTMEQWQVNLNQFFELDLPHLSAYGLTIEPRTHYGYLLRKKSLKIENDIVYNQQFEVLMERAIEYGFEHYEISNFGKPDYHSKHNSSYWFGQKYLGIGPSAHSFDGVSRQWNVSSNLKYIQGVASKDLNVEKEILRVEDKYNEYLLTRLRTKWGVRTKDLEEGFGVLFLEDFEKNIQPYVKSGHVLNDSQTYVLTKKGKYLADKISSDLFLVV
jgi:oxygen-independent coproporphyrinogen-3 oxidase